MSNGDFWNKVEQGINKAADWMQSEYERKERELQKKLANKTDDEIMRISGNPDLPEFQRGLVDREMRRRGL